MPSVKGVVYRSHQGCSQVFLMTRGRIDTITTGYQGIHPFNQGLSKQISGARFQIKSVRRHRSSGIEALQAQKARYSDLWPVSLAVQITDMTIMANQQATGSI